MKRALVIGINDYPQSPLTACESDAAYFSSIIETNGDGSPNFNVRLYTKIRTRAELTGHINTLFAYDCEVALLYFAGHGCIGVGGGYIATPDYKKFDEGVSMDDILEMANRSPARNKIIILDCCYSGHMGKPEEMGGKNISLTKGITILTASLENQLAYEINGHGVFTSLLVDALQGGAADLRGNITPGSVYTYIDQSLGAWDQRPIFKTNITQFVSLRKVQPKIDDEVLRKIVEYFPDPESEYRLDPSYEDTNSPDVVHQVMEPHAKKEHTVIFKHLQKYQSGGLVTPVDARYMYFAAMESKSCRLTALGYHYWRLVKDKRI